MANYRFSALTKSETRTLQAEFVKGQIFATGDEDSGGYGLSETALKLHNFKQVRLVTKHPKNLEPKGSQDIKNMNTEYKYDIALSFAGEDRDFVENVALQLQGYGVKVFYDKFEEDNLWGKNLYDYLHTVYTKNAKFTVMFVSKNYKKKLWTNHEREAMQERAFESSSEYILPARFDDTEIPGIRSTTGYIDLTDHKPSYLVSLILKKIEWQPKKRWWGNWKVDSVTSAFSSFLEIRKVTKQGFTFDLSTFHGAHLGQIDGTAVFLNTDEASYKSESYSNEICKLTFRKTNDVIQVTESEGCRYFCGMRAYFNGDYVLKKDSFYDRIIVSDANLSAIHSILGDNYWSYYTDCFSDIHRPDSIDGETEIITGGMPGLYTICESILMIKGNNIWGAFLQEQILYYFSTTDQKNLPKTIEKWKERFNEKKVVLLK